VPDHSENSAKARLIQELPRDATPSASDRNAVMHESAASGVRRGLDESQLGKRLAKRVRTMFRLLDEVDYYQILGIDPEAPNDVLRTAYFDLSLEFHPDRFFLLRSGDLKEKIYAIYRRITEAYGVLSDARRRAAYDAARRSTREKRASPELRDDTPQRGDPAASCEMLRISATSAKAKRFIELAQAAFQDGDLSGTRLLLHLALTYESGNAPLRAAIDDVARRSASA
jgi:curved DNA-binding protein CbpA